MGQVRPWSSFSPSPPVSRAFSWCPSSPIYACCKIIPLILPLRSFNPEPKATAWLRAVAVGSGLNDERLPITAIRNMRITPMDERFTDRAREVLQLAAQEAQRCQHEYIGTEHILLGLLREGSGSAVALVKSLGVELAQIRAQLERFMVKGPDRNPTGKKPPHPTGQESYRICPHRVRPATYMPIK